MKPLLVTADVTYGLFELTDLDEMAVVLATSFGHAEPLAIAAGLTGSDIARIVAIFGPKAAQELLTVVARSPNGTMVGALLAQDFATALPEGLDRVSDAFQPISALLDGLDETYRRSKIIVPGAYLHLFMVGVLPRCEGQKIAQALVTTCLKNALDRGYRTAVTEATGSASQHILRRFGFVDQLTSNYADFTFQGRIVFRSIKDPTGTILMDKQLV